MKNADSKGKRGGGGRGDGDRNEEKGYKKGIIIFLLTRALPGTPASRYI